MDASEIKGLKEWFFSYVENYLTQDATYNEPIILKRSHTFRVIDETLMIAASAGLKDHDIFIAETIALFHDIGRFPQYARYGTFRDAISEDHAQLGLRELAKHEVLARFSSQDQALIRNAISYHNLRVVPGVVDDKTALLFTQLIRDADKLDIWRIFIDLYEGQHDQSAPVVAWGLPNEPSCAPIIVAALREFKMANTQHMVTLNDYKLVQLSWVFDLNFAATCCAVLDRRYIERIQDTIHQEVREEISKTLYDILAFLKKRAATITCCE